MKLKKFMFTASSIAVGTSLLGTVLTSCGKATVDDKLKIDLDDNGFLSDDKTSTNYKMAIKMALSRSTNWAQFKAALADELVYRWYVDRAAPSKDSNSKNSTFRVNLDEWTDKVNKDYEETIKSLKNKYTDNWEFYLQNEYLSPNGGTEESYKHVKLVEKVRAEFLSKVFATNYFGYKTGDAEGTNRQQLPNIYTKASINLSEDALKNPESWSKLGFYARTNANFSPDNTENVDANFLAKHPDGDYAVIQDYVFNRWFDTEKPFFSAASLFKYSNPKYVADSKLAEIYNGTSTGTKIPDNPNEAFPFFGGYASTESGKGTRAYASWFTELCTNGFETTYEDANHNWVTNHTISIPKTMTEDSQTLLLSFGSQMIGGSANALYIPYANAAASLYLQMIINPNEEEHVANYKPRNTITQEWMGEGLEQAVYGGKSIGLDNFAILNNFFFTDDNLPSTIKSSLDLSKVYGSVSGSTKYHCPIFKENKTYTDLYGVKDTTNGVQYITNTVQVELGKIDSEGKWTEGATQPWILELNEAGMHAQTIDGYQYVKTGKDASTRKALLKNVLKYRLMQKKCGYNDALISADVFGDSGKLKSYFNDNFTNIILELAFNTSKQTNIFKSIDSYALLSEDQNTFFLQHIVNDEAHKFISYENLVDYIKLTTIYDNNKKYVEAYETANSKTYAYRTKQMENARTEKEHLTVFENGLLAPIAYTYTSNDKTETGKTPKAYYTSDITLMDANGAVMDTLGRQTLKDNLAAVTSSNFVKECEETNPNIASAFSPQISTAKSKKSNRAWYKSWIVDKMMYQFMSNKDGLANYIKTTAMDKYISGNATWNEAVMNATKNPSFMRGWLATYGESKLFTDNRTYAYYGEEGDEDASTFYSNLLYGVLNEYNEKIVAGGEYCDAVLNYYTYLSAVNYLIGNDNSFTNFYNILNTKISEDEMALVGYINKTNKNIFENTDVATTDLTTDERYLWTADVNNIFDNTGYTGGSSSSFENSKIACDQYWKVIEKHVGNGTGATKALAGFTGIQTKSSNQIDSGSKLQEAVFDKFARCSNFSRVLTDSKVDSKYIVDGRYGNNYGCWFAYAGTKNANGEVLNFEPVTSGETTITRDNFKLSDDKYSPALKLAKKIAEYRTQDDLRALAKKLGAAYYGDNTFRQIGDGTIKENDVNVIKVLMLNELLKTENLICFQRATDIEVHSEGSDKSGSKKYGFSDDKGNTYRILMTQINKADVTEKNFAPSWNNDTKTWTANPNSPITQEEFWYIFANMATDSSVQQLAISDVVKSVYGDAKLVVYDAQLYNCFDTVWIKDWSKKTMGA